MIVPHRRTLVLLTVALTMVAAGFVAAFGGGFTDGGSAYAASEHTVTFVNRSGQDIWIGSTVNADGSQPLTGLPHLRDGESAVIVIPENSGPGHWRGKFWARQGCDESSGEFRCAVGDCGPAADRCLRGDEPASLAEFNFDPDDPYGAPWYNVSYVNAVSLPITITPTGSAPLPRNGQYCAEAGCAKPLLDACPRANLIPDRAGKPMVCVNPDRDAETEYSRALTGLCPRAYSWSKQDAVQGNQTMYNCTECTNLTVTFHGNGPQQQPAPQAPPVRSALRVGETGETGEQIVSQWNGKCVDVPGGDYSDRVRLTVWTCWNGPMQRFEFAGDGTVRIGGKCVDVADGSVADMAAVQVFTCNGTPAQQWVFTEAGDLVNPQADKCLDIGGWNAADGAPLQLWTCNGFANQKWRRG